MKSRFLMIASVLVLLLCAGGYYFWTTIHTPNIEARYLTAKVERGDLTQMASANGTLNPVTLINVGTQVSGTVKKWYADFNDHVKEGQVLLELDPDLYNEQLSQSKASLASAQSQLKLAEANLARSRALFAQEYVTHQDLDSSIQADEAARALVAQMRAQVDRDRTNLGYSVIRSPVAGVVVSREVDLGQTVAASFQTPTLFKIAQDLSKMQIDSSYAEADIGSLQVGQSVVFRVDAFPNRSFNGVVRQVRLNPTTVQNVVTYDVVVAVDNPEQILMPGMTAYVNIIVATRRNVLLVPNAALRFRPVDVGDHQDKPKESKPGDEKTRGKDKQDVTTGTVQVLENGKLKPVRVVLGITDSRSTEVVGSELKEGDAVVVEDRQPPAKAVSGPPMRMF